MKIFVLRKTIINEFAKEIAHIHQRADREYYKPHLNNYEPVPHENEFASWILDDINALNKMCRKLNIIQKVYDKAYKIYDFRNSGKPGYTLKEGKIVLREESEGELE